MSTKTLLMDMIIALLENESLRVPSNFDYVAVDADGDVFAFEGSVFTDGDEWLNDDAQDVHYVGTISNEFWSGVRSWRDACFDVKAWNMAVSE